MTMNANPSTRNGQVPGLGSDQNLSAPKRPNSSLQSSNILSNQKTNGSTSSDQKGTVSGSSNSENRVTINGSSIPGQISESAHPSTNQSADNNVAPPKEPRLEPSGSNNQNPNAVFRCEWYSCSSKFEKWQEVFHHCCRVHCSDVGPEGAICQWRSCDGLRRKKLSLFTHLNEKHCTEALL